MKTTNQFTLLISLAAIVFPLFLLACSSITESAVAMQQLHILKAGDNFTYHDHATDTAGTITPGSDTMLTATVKQTGLSIKGKNNVTMIVKGTDTTYMAEAGDSSYSILQNQIGIISGVSLPGIWVSFDPGQRGNIIFDSTQNTIIAGMPAKIHATIVMNYLGKDIETINGSSLTVLKFSKVVGVAVMIMGQDFTTTVTVLNNYAPAIGYFVERNVQSTSNTDQSPVPSGTSYSLLQSYHIQ